MSECAHFPRFGDPGINTPGRGSGGVDGVTEAGAQDDGDIGPDAPQRASQSVTGHAWHGLIGHDEVKALRCRPKSFQGLPTAEADDDLIAEALDQWLPHVGHGGLIIDQQEPPL